MEQRESQLNEPERQAGGLAGRASRALGNVRDNVRDNLPDADAVREGLKNPIGLIVGAAAAGFLAGLFVPVSDFEQAKLRPIADDLAEHAADVRDEILEHGRSAIAETAAAAQESVQNHAKELASSIGGTSNGDSTNGGTPTV